MRLEKTTPLARFRFTAAFAFDFALVSIVAVAVRACCVQYCTVAATTREQRTPAFVVA
jgi:hypothetical protein